jgi:Flp pilus assembly protein TadG
MQTSRRSRPLRRQNPLKREDGQAAFELMLVLPFFVLFLLLAVDMGIMMYEFVSVANGAREGARLGAVCASTCDATSGPNSIQQRVADRSGGIVSPSDVQVDWVNRGGSAAATDKGDSVVVHVSHNYGFLFFPATVDITSCADMRLEQNETVSGTKSGGAC